MLEVNGNSPLLDKVRYGIEKKIKELAERGFVLITGYAENGQPIYELTESGKKLADSTVEQFFKLMEIIE